MVVAVFHSHFVQCFIYILFSVSFTFKSDERMSGSVRQAFNMSCQKVQKSVDLNVYWIDVKAVVFESDIFSLWF